MSRWLLASLASIFLVLAACAPNAAPSLPADTSGQSAFCPAITTATSVQVLLPPSPTALRKTAYLVTDAEAVRRLVNFVNLRRSVSPPSVRHATFTATEGHFLLWQHERGDLRLGRGSVLSSVRDSTRHALRLGHGTGRVRNADRATRHRSVSEPVPPYHTSQRLPSGRTIGASALQLHAF